MKRFFLLTGLVGLAVLVMAARPPAEFPMFLRLNGEPAFIGTSVPGADGGTLAIIDAGAGQVVKTQCHAKCCVCPGLACVCPSATNLAIVGNANVGEVVQADGVQFTILQDTTSRISVAPYAGSVMPDGGAGAWADHWIMR